MRAVLAGVLLFLFAGQPATAGAWLREHKHGFSSVSSTLRRLPDRVGQENSIYLEYGVRPKLTLGLDLNEGDNLSGHGLVFARFALGKRPGTRPRKNHLAVETAIGAHYQGDVFAPMYKLTLSWGRSLQTKRLSAWLAVDLAGEQRKGLPGPTLKMDTTLGLNGVRRVQPMLQIETSRPKDGIVNWAVIPSLRIARRNGITWVVGIERKFAGQHSVGVKFSIWKNFRAKEKAATKPRGRPSRKCLIICPYGRRR